MDELKEYLELLIEAKVPISYYGETFDFELEAKFVLNSLLRRLDDVLLLNGNSANIVQDILETKPAIKKEGLEASLLRFHLEVLDDMYEDLIQKFPPTSSPKRPSNDCLVRKTDAIAKSILELAEEEEMEAEDLMEFIGERALTY